MELPTQRHFLTLWERLSQIYLNKYSLFLALLAIKIHLFRNTLVSTLTSLSEYPSPCLDSQNVAVSLQAVTKMLNGLIMDNLATIQYSYVAMIACLAKTIKALLQFYIEIFLGTYTCLLNATISGAANLAADASEDVVVFVNSTMVGLAHDIQDGLDGLSKMINTLIQAYSKVKSFFSGSDTADPLPYTNKINISIAALNNFSIPSSVLTDISKFRDTDIPQFANLENSTQNLIAAPFDVFVSSILQLKSTRNFTLLQPLTEDDLYGDIDPWCSTHSLQISNTFKDLATVVNSTVKIMLIVLAVCAAMALIPTAWRAYRDHRRFSQYAREFHHTPFAQEIDPLALPVVSGNIIDRYQSALLYSLFKYTSLVSPHLYWSINYVSTPSASLIFLVGLFGIVSACLQFSLLSILSKAGHQLKSLANDGPSVTAIANATALYLENVNGQLRKQSIALNDELFGDIHSVSSGLNSTIVGFMDNLNSSLSDLFGNTPFAAPINTVVYCTLGRKLERLESGLTWINTNLNIEIPPLSKDLNQDILSIVQSKQVSTLGISLLTAFDAAVSTCKRAIWLELKVALAIFGLWAFQVLVASIIVVFRRYTDNVMNEYEDEKMSVISIANKLHAHDVSSPIALSRKERMENGYPVSAASHIIEPPPTRQLPPHYTASSCYSPLL